MEPAVLKALNAARDERRAVAVVTDLGDGRDRVVSEDDAIPGELGAAIAEAFRSGKAAPVSVSGRDFFINVHLPPVRMVIVGAVHISQALAPMASAAGFHPEIIDPRTAFATPERFAGIELSADWPEMVLAQRPLDRWCALVALTHDPKIDDHPIRAALEAECFYVGALGSRKTHGRRIERLIAAGADPDAVSRIRGPIGLPIGASTPAEIGVSILAEIIGERRKSRSAPV
ncbi:XdhC family protein [Oceaniradius stylonematis]|uniref:XdhC family protein n=1 Tax=Oceaniradius stylonematis TaxID=2184161 RepID=A0A3A8AR64_9HYPH|nr:XdhC family protein [Oceaniradius stylonematis]RKF08071.1 XdhC family protein [Oceaniradius stylonematis]